MAFPYNPHVPGTGVPRGPCGSPGNQFPYTVQHDANLNYICETVAKTNEAFQTLDADFGKLVDYVNNYDMFGENNVYKSVEAGWWVRTIKKSVNVSQGFVEKYKCDPLVLSGVRYAYISPVLTKILPLPLDDVVPTGSVDSYRGIMINPRVVNKSLLRYQYLHFDSGAYNKDIIVRGNVAMSGIHAAPPVTPKYPAMPKRSEVIAIADTYYQSRLHGRKYAYGANFVTYATSDKVNNSAGAALMECDTLVAMVMMAIPYDRSPYANDTPGYTYHFEDMDPNPTNTTWALPWKFDSLLNRKVTYSGGQNWWLWYNSMVYQDKSLTKIAAGDIAIFRKNTSKYFDGISHIGIVNTQYVNGTRVPYLYHITGLSGVESPMMFEPLSNVIERGGYTMNDVYFARPNYR